MRTFITALKVLGILAILSLVGVGFVFWPNIKGVLPAIQPPVDNIADLINNSNNSEPGQNNTEFPLSLPDGFRMDIVAQGIDGARVMVFDDQGNLWVSRTSKGVVTRLKLNSDNDRFETSEDVFKNLRNPHGIAFDYQDYTKLYIAEEHQISLADLSVEGAMDKIADLPAAGGGHSTRTIAFGPDGRLYVSIGSSCNVCGESDERRAAIYSMNKDGSDFKQYASGLRNAVFFDWSYVDGRMWATEMGRDLLGDDIPPDEINIIQDGHDYGWPICYGQNIHDASYDKSGTNNTCAQQNYDPSAIDLQAHSAPLGLAFIPEEGWPESMWYDLVVAYHGSWNRTEPTGYKLVRIDLDQQGNYHGTSEFVAGWLTPNGVLGRPVDVIAQPGGVMYVSDDKAGVIYKLSYQSK